MAAMAAMAAMAETAEMADMQPRWADLPEECRLEVLGFLEQKDR